MKRIFTLCILALILVCSCQSGSQSFSVKGKVEGLPDGTSVELYCMIDEVIAEAEIIGGQFELCPEIGEPTYLSLRVKGSYDRVVLMVDPKDNVSVTGTVTGDKGKYDWSGVKVKGASLNDLLEEKMASRRELDNIYNEMHVKYADIISEMGNARGAQDAARIQEIEGRDEWKEVISTESYIFEQAPKVLDEAVASNKDTFWAPLMMLLQTGYLTEDMRYLYEQMGPDAQNSKYGQYVKSQVAPEGLVGKAFPEFECTLADGSASSFKKLCEGKKYVLVDFWASWCNPCRKEIPNVKAQYELYKDKGFDVISISTDTDDDKWRKALDEEKLPWPNMIAASVNMANGQTVSQAYNIRFIPLMYIVDVATGQAIAENIRGEELVLKLAELFSIEATK